MYSRSIGAYQVSIQVLYWFDMVTLGLYKYLIVAQLRVRPHSRKLFKYKQNNSVSIQDEFQPTHHICITVHV